MPTCDSTSEIWTKKRHTDDDEEFKMMIFL